MTDNTYIEPEIPAEFKLKRTVATSSDKLVDSYEAWRVIILDPADGSIQFYANRNGSEDYKTEQNAKKIAHELNMRNTEPFYRSYYGEKFIAIARKCKVTIEEIK